MIAETISHYRVLSQVSGNGTPVVYEAEDLHASRRVALKWLPKALEGDAIARESCIREALAVSALKHPNICSVYEIGDCDGRHFVAMEWLEGQTLKRQMNGQPLQMDRVVDVGVQIAEALEAAHAKGIIHRDIRPEKIFLAASDHAKLLDFGLAKPCADKSGVLGDTTRGTAATVDGDVLTSAGSRVGGIAYLSPEQARGKSLDARTDLFSLGVVLYEMATGMLPFRGETPAIVFDAILNRTPVAAARLNPEIPAKLQEIIAKLLEKKRELRYQGAAQVRADLERLKKTAVAEEQSIGIPHGILPPPRRSRSGKLGKYLSALALLAAICAGAVFLYMKRERGLTEKDAILLTDFVNTTADPVWDVTLKKALAVDLEQSPYLNVFPEAKARQTLRFMGRPPDDRINRQTGLEICQRAGIKAMLTGSITNQGTQYAITLQAVNANTGDVLARAEGQAANKNEVLNALHKMDSQMRGKLGESLASIQRYDMMLSQATTPSLEALNAFTRGDSKHAGGDEMAAIPEYQRAIELDPNFASAYARLGTVYSNLGQSVLSEQNRKKAFELRDRASEREKLYIMSHYYADSGQYDKGITALELYEQTYPRDSTPANNLGNIYNQLGQFENALDKSRKAVQLEPDSISGYENLAIAYAGLNRMDEAKATVVEALKRAPRNSGLHAILAGIAWNQNDAATLEQELGTTENSGPDGQLMGLNMRAELAVGHGQFAQMRRLTEKIQEAATLNRLQEAAANAEAQRAIWEALGGFRPVAQKAANHALQSEPPTNAMLNAGIALALIHQDDRALKIASDEALERPFNTLVQFVTIPSIKAIVAMNHNEPKKAIDLLDGAMVYGRSNLGVMYARGLAYLEAKQAAQAIQEFQRVLDSRSFNCDPLASLAKLGLARAQAMAGDKAASRTAYQDFLALWKDADPDVPLLLQAKAEYAAVQ
jgi:serine/threonine protein kinase/tetratricopeptide (TPR) repeat protein